MGIVQLSGVSLSFGPRTILDNVTFSIQPGKRLALTGANGSGKSTLMKIIAGITPQDSGSRTIQKDTLTAYLPQSGISHGGRSLKEEADLAFERFSVMEKEKEAVEKRLSIAREQTEEVETLLEHQHYLTEKLIGSGYYTRMKEIDRVLTGLGFSRDDFSRDTAEFSGGWQMRIALAKVLLLRPDILLLDEPTNYLDLEAKNWIESFLLSLSDGYLIVSHDRHFLDTVVTETAELFCGRLKVYRGGYTQYEEKRRKEVEDLISRYEQQQEEIEKIEFFIRRFRYNASKAQLVQSRIKQLDRIERLEIPESMKRIHFTFPEAPHSGRDVLRVETLGKAYGAREVFGDVSFFLHRGRRLVVTGVNGAGKSTLLRILAGKDSSYTGSFYWGTGVKTGYFSQDLEEDPDRARPILEDLEASAPTHLVPKLRNLLGAFLFRGDDVYKPLGVLSGGERNRVALLKLLLKPVNMLIMDEPTNHLDLTSKDVLLEALKGYTGTLIFVSHDRYFIEKLADEVLEIKDGKATLYPGNYLYYLDKTGSPDSGPGSAQAAGPALRESDESAGGPVPDREAEKKKKNQINRLKQEEADILKTLGKLEKERKDLEISLNDPEIYGHPVKARETQEALDRNQQHQDQLGVRWEEIHAFFLEN